jgi:hypothetical protein
MAYEQLALQQLPQLCLDLRAGRGRPWLAVAQVPVMPGCVGLVGAGCVMARCSCCVESVMAAVLLAMIRLIVHLPLQGLARL